MIHTTLSYSTFENFCRLFLKETGMRFGNEKHYLLHQRLQPLLELFNFAHFEELFFQADTKNTEVLRACINAVTTTETFFFRDSHPFAVFKDIILPELGDCIVKRKTGTHIRKGAKVSIWSAASATGQEPYSLAMLVSDFVEASCGKYTPDQFEICASDINNAALTKAVSGKYTEFEVSRGLPIEMRDRYLFRTNREWLISEKICRMVTFREQNLAAGLMDMQGFDCIFCRNVLVYFDPAIRISILNDLCRLLSPGGTLFLGAAENILSVPFTGRECLITVDAGRTAFYRKQIKSSESGICMNFTADNPVQ